MSNFPKLTKLEREILEHRLEVPDAIAETLEEYHPDDVAAVADFILNGEIKKAEAINKEISNDVLRDAVEGSTFLGAASDESDQRQAAIYRAGESLAKKIGDYIGKTLEYPPA